MKKSDVFLLGKISRKHGYKGDIAIKLDVSPFPKLKELNFLFIEMNNSLVPFFVEKLSFKNNQFIIVSFEDINNEKETVQIIGKDVYIEKKDLPKNIELDKLSFVGYKIIDKNLGQLGLIEGVSSNSIQDIFHLTYKNKLVLIPFVENFIDKIDKENSTIYINTPPGLIDLYLD
jgi:16S rRNA processing protein RimM